MAAIFPSAEWLNAFQSTLNSDARYGEIARNWEGDLLLDIQPDGTLTRRLLLYFDLWHGKCRAVDYDPAPEKHPKPAFALRSQYDDITSILLGKLDPMTAILTSRLKLAGSLAYMMRNVPTVLDFVRCAREITTEIL